MSSPPPGFAVPEAPSRRAPLALLIAVTATGPFALNVLMPALPTISEVFAAPYGTVQLTLSLYLIGMAVGQLLYGPLSDRYGRRPLLLIGMGLYVVGSLACALAPTIHMLIVGRVLQALGGSAGMVLSRAVVRDCYDRERSASMIAYITMAMVVAPMVAPVIGGTLVDNVAWWGGVAVAAGIGGVILAWALRAMGETLAEPMPMPGLMAMLASYRRLVALPAFRGYSAMVALSSAGFFAFLGGAPYVVITVMGETPAAYGLFFMMTAASYMIGNFVSGRASTRVGIDTLIAIGGWLCFAGTGLMLALALFGMVSPWAVFLPMTVFSLGNGLTIANGLAGAVSTDPRLAGAASGLSGFMQIGTGAVASIAVGHLVEGAASQLPMVVVMFATSICGIVAAMMTPRVAHPAPSAAQEAPAR